MNMLNLSENILRLRRERKITQEELADFAGVTKASVSKWESGKSTPDIMLLPLLASFFDVTVDALIGYEPQLSKEQIRRIITDCGFVSESFYACTGKRAGSFNAGGGRAVLHTYFEEL